MFSWLRRLKSAESPAQWMVVLSTNNISEAHIVAGRLRHEGIPAWVHQQPGASGLGITVGLLGEVRVLVNADDYQTALDILRTPVPDEIEPENRDVRFIFPADDPEIHDSQDE